MKLYVEDAYNFYKRHILDREKLSLMEKFNFKVNGSVPFQYWELFAAILTNRKAVGGYGTDLPGLEVKSAKEGCSFEYQYHKNAGLTKLREDMEVSHMYISYSTNYENVVVRLVDPNQFKDIFSQWEEELKVNYGGDSLRQRFRKSISFGRVCEAGKLIVSINGGILTGHKK